MKKNNNFEINLDEEEKLLLNSYENQEWTTIQNFNQEKEFALAAANSYLKKDTRINIRISSIDLKRIKQKAAFEGLPYQTLITSILHKYSAGH